jgi:hypothetical protein
MVRRLQAADHQVDHCKVDHCLAGLRLGFVVFAQAPTFSQPGKGTISNPTFGQDLERVDVIRSFHNLEDPSCQLLRPVDQLASLAAVRPDPLETRELPDQLLQNQLGAQAILNAGGMDRAADHGGTVRQEPPVRKR